MWKIVFTLEKLSDIIGFMSTEGKRRAIQLLEIFQKRIDQTLVNDHGHQSIVFGGDNEVNKVEDDKETPPGKNRWEKSTSTWKPRYRKSSLW